MERAFRIVDRGLHLDPLITAVARIPEQWWTQDTRRHPGTNGGVAVDTQAIRLTDPAMWARFAPLVDPLVARVTASAFPGITGRRGKVSFSRIPAGKAIALHIDREPDQATLHRVHVPLITNTEARLEFPQHQARFCGRVGKAYEINSMLPHQAVNRGDTDRVHLVFDYHF